jgi:hypothetical protein
MMPVDVQPDTSNAHSKKWGAWRRHLPVVVAVTISLIATIAFLTVSYRASRFKSPIWFDGPVLGIEEGFRTGRIYQASALTTPPYIVVTHPPLSYLIGYPVYAAGFGSQGLRFLNLLITLGCAALIGVLGAGPRNSFRKIQGFLAASVFVALPPIARWSQLIRFPDALACLFELGIILLLTRRRITVRRELVVGLLFTLAILSKQSSLLTFGPVLIWQAFRDREPKRLASIRFATCAVLLAAFCIYMQWSTRGGFVTNVFYANLMAANLGSYLCDLLLELGYFWPFAIAIFYFSRGAPGIVRIWFLASTITAVLTDWKDGANTLYFFESCASLAILSGFAFRSKLEEVRPRAPLRESIAVVMLGLIIFRTYTAYAWPMSDPTNATQYSALVNYLRERKAPGRQVLTQDPSLSLTLGEQPLWNDALVLGALAQQHRWDDSYIVSQLHEARFYAVVSLMDYFWTPRMMKELTEHYYVAATFGGTFKHTVYLPRSVATPRM